MYLSIMNLKDSYDYCMSILISDSFKIAKISDCVSLIFPQERANTFFFVFNSLLPPSGQTFEWTKLEHTKKEDMKGHFPHWTFFHPLPKLVRVLANTSIYSND